MLQELESKAKFADARTRRRCNQLRQGLELSLQELNVTVNYFLQFFTLSVQYF
jgi:hypothetical protein